MRTTLITRAALAATVAAVVAAAGCGSSAPGAPPPAPALTTDPGLMAGNTGVPVGAVARGTGPDPSGVRDPDVGLARAVGRKAGVVGGKDVEKFVNAQAQLARDPARVVFREHTFDPAGPGPTFRDRTLSRPNRPPLPGTREKWVVQFDRVPTRAQRDALAAAGTILRYVPNQAYLVELDLAGHLVVDAQRRLLGVRAMIPFHPGLKFQPDISARLDGSNPELGPMGLGVTTFRGRDAADVADAIRALGDPDITVLHVSDEGDLGMIQVVLANVGPLAALTDFLAELEEVEAIDELRQPEVMNDSSIWVIQSGDKDSQATPLFDRDLLGTGQVVTVMDTGIDPDHCAMRYDGSPGAITTSSSAQSPTADVTAPGNKIIAYYLNGGSAYEGECTHGTHVAGSVAGDNYAHRSTSTDVGHDDGDGMAPNAKLIMQDIGGPSMWGSCGLSIGNLGNAFAQSYASGSRIHTNSWGSISTSYAAFSYTVDQHMWEKNDYLVLFAAANSGPRVATLNTYATHKNGLAIAAASHGLTGSDDLASFSSHGPTADGRIKPDLAAPGESINSALATGVENDANCGTVHYSGTSMATPTAAGGAALVRQYFGDGFYPSGQRNPSDVRNPSAALVKAVMVNSGRNMTGAFTATDGANGASAPIPTSGQGWGRLTLDDALYFQGDARGMKVLNDVWNGATSVVAPATTAAITTGVTHTFTVDSVGCAEPLKFTLNWSDPPGAVGSGIQLVNNLDLEVVAPDGTIYKGNVFSGGWSVAAGAADTLNSIENVYLRYPLPGTYTVRVIGRSVPGKGVTTPFDDTRQGYALVATGEFSGSTAPSFVYEDHQVGGGCDDDIYLDEGETAQLELTIRNRGCSASSASTQVTLSVDPSSEIPASQISFGAASQTYGAITGDGTATRSFDITLASSPSSWAGKAATLLATMTDPVSGVTRTKQLRITSSLDEVDAFVDRVEDDVNVGWTNRPSDESYTMDQRPWQLVPGVYGAPSPQVWSDASGPGAFELQNIHSGWISPMTPVAATDTMSSFEFWRYVDFGTATAGTSQAIIYYFDSPTGVINGAGMTGWTVARAYSPGLPDGARWVREEVALGPQPPGTTHFRIVLMLRLLDGPAEGAFFDQLRVRKLVPDTKPPCGETCSTAPSFAGVATADATCGMIELAWAPAAATCGGSIRYDVYRSTSPSFAGAVRVSPCGLEDTRFVDTDVTTGTTYYYRVHAEDYANGSGACGGNEDANAVTIAATPSTGAPVFAGITSSAAANACSTATLTWSPAAPLCAGGAIRYNVYRSTTPGQLGARVSTCGAVAGTSFQDTGLTPGTTYHYTVRAVDSADPACAAGHESTNTAQTAVTPTDTTPPATTAAPTAAYTTCGGAVTVTWPAATDACTGVDDYVVYRSTTAGVLGTPVGTTSGLTWSDTVDPTVTHYYTVHARDGAGNEATAVTQGATSMRPTFAGASLVKPGTTDCGSIEVYWPAATAGCPTSGLHYNVYRSVDPGFVPGPTNRITTCGTAPTGTSFVDTNVIGGTRYYYVVRAEDESTTGDGPCGGYEDTNTTRQSGYPEDVLFADGFETGIDPLVWEASAGFSASTAQHHDGAGSVHAGNTAGQCDALTLAQFIALPAESVSLSFWSRYDIDPNRDRGIVEISTDGSTWTKVTPIGGYPGVTVSGTSCIGGSYATAFTGSSGGQWRPYKVDLTPWAGASVKLRFRFGSDAASTTPGGWYVDDISLSSAGLCFACEVPPTFAGLTSVTASGCGAVNLAWSAAAEGCPGKVVHYNVYRSTVQGQLGQLLTSCGSPVLGTTYTDATLEPATTYYYTVRAEDGSTGMGGPCGGNVAVNDNQLPGTASDTTSPSFAGLTSAANQCTTGDVKLAWTPATDTCSGVKDYLVFRSTSPTAIGDQIATVQVPYAADDSGSGNEAEVRAATRVTGYAGDGVQLTGNAVAIVNPGGVALGASWEIEAWFKWPFDNGNNTAYHTLTRGTGCGDHQIIVHTDQKSLGGYDNCTGGNWKDSGYDLDVLAPGWHHVRAVGSGTTTTYYVDGVQAGSPVAWKSTSNVYAVGNHQTGAQAFGTIDEVKVRVNGVDKAHWSFTGLADPVASYLDTPPGPGAYTYTVWARDRGGATNYSTVKVTATSSADLSFAGVQTATAAGLCSASTLTWAAADPACGANGGVAQDGSTGDRDGTLIGTRPATGKDGAARTAIELTGDDHVSVPSSAALNPTTITLEAWVHPTSYSNYGTIIAKRPDNTANAQYLLRNYSTTGRVELWVYAGGGWRTCTTATADVTPLNTWTHVAGTYDGLIGRVYLNGVEKCTFAYAGAIQTGTGALYIGREQYNGYVYQGLIDEVRVYPGARSAAQIAGDAATTALVDPATVAASYSFTGEGGLNYNVYRADAATGPWTRVSSCGVSGTTWSDAGLVREREYFYKVQVEDSIGSGGPCGGTEITNDTVLSAIPTDTSDPSFSYFNATATANCSTGDIDLSWPVASDCSTDQLTYRVFRSTEAGVAGVEIYQSAAPLSPVAQDGSPNDNDGTIVGPSPVAGKDGVAATALTTGAGYVSVLSTASLNPTAAITLEAWVYPTSFASSGTFLRKSYDSGGNDQYYLRNYSTTGRVEAGLYLNAAWRTCITPAGASTETPLNTWSHAAATYDGTTIRVYVNGVQAAACAQTGAIPTGDRKLYLGGHAYYGNQFAGRLDEVRVYPAARSAAQIAADAATTAIVDPTLAAGAWSFTSEGASPWRYSDTTAVPGQSYYYAVFADDGEGQQYGGEFGALTQACTEAGTCTTGPAFAGITSADNATAASCGGNAVEVTWDPATPTCFGHPIHYDVYRSATPGALGTLVSSCATPPTGTSFVDTTAPAGTWYYTVRAEDSFTTAGGSCGGHADGNLAQLPVVVTGNSHDDLAPATTTFAGVDEVTGGGCGLDPVVAWNGPDEEAETLAARDCTATTLARWRFDDGAARDDSGNVNDGVLGGVVVGSSPGQDGTGSALAFNGTASSFVRVASSDSLSPTGDVSVEAWVNPTTYVNSGRVVDKGNMYRLYTYSTTGQIVFGVYVNGNWRECTTSSTDAAAKAPLATWTHVRGTYDGQNVRVYVSGVEKCVLAYPGAIVRTTLPLYLGAFNETGTTGHWNGKLDTIRIDETGREQRLLAAVRRHTGTAAVYKLDDGAAADSSGHANHGTLGSATTTAAGAPGLGNALAFADVASSYVRIEDDPSFDASAGLALEAWVKPDVFEYYGNIVSKRFGGPAEYYLRHVGYGGTIAFGVWIDGAWRTCTTTEAIVLATWTHLAASYDGKVGRVAFNGVEKCSFAYEGAIAHGNAPIYLGTYDGTNGEAFDGTIDDVRIHVGPVASTAGARRAVAAWFPFDADGDDRVFGGADATLAGGAAIGPGYQGRALVLDGVDDRAVAADAPARNPGLASFTVAAWVKTTATSGTLAAKGNASGSAAGWRVELDGTGLVRAVLADGTTAVTATGTSSIADGAWHHVAAVFDRATGAGLQLYVDGAAQVASPPALHGLAAPATTAELSIGATSGAPSAFWSGAIDELTVRAYAATAAQLRGDADADSRLGGWRVYRSTAAGVLGALVATVPRRQLTWTDDATLAPGTYRYTVRAVDRAGVEDTGAVQATVEVSTSAPSFAGVTSAFAGSCGDAQLALAPASTCSSTFGAPTAGIRELDGNVMSYPASLNGRPASPNVREWSGRLNVPSPGTYTFRCDKYYWSDCHLWIDGAPVALPLDGSSTTITHVFAAGGYHDVRFRFTPDAADSTRTVALQWSCTACVPAVALQPIPAAVQDHLLEERDVLRYAVYRSTTPGVRGPLVASCQAAANGSLVDRPPGNGTYYYTVNAEDLSVPGAGPCGGTPDTNDAQVAVAPTDTGYTNFAGASTITNACDASGAITITWPAWADSCSATREFRIYRSPFAEADGELLATVGPAVTSYVDTTGDPGTTYYYRVFAVDVFGNFDPSVSQVSATASNSQLAPSFAGVSSVNAGNYCNYSSLSWPAASARCTGDAISYNVFRADSASGPFTQVATGLTSTSWSHPTTLTTGAKYHWRVRAVADGTSESNTKTLAATVTDTGVPTFAGLSAVTSDCASGGTNMLSWGTATDTCSPITFDVYRSTAEGALGGVVASLPAGTTSWSDTTAATGTTYSYAVLARDAWGNRSTSVVQRTIATANQVPSFGGLRTVVQGSRCNEAVLSWVPGTSACAGAQLHYNVYRSATPGSLGTMISEATNHVLKNKGAFARATSALRSGDTVAFDVMPTSTYPNFRAYLLTPDDLYGVGIVFENNRIYPRWFQGSTSGTNGANLLSQVKPGVWYRVTLKADDVAGFTVEVGERDAGAPVSYNHEGLPPGRLDWGWNAYGDTTKPEVYVDHYVENAATGTFTEDFEVANAVDWSLGPDQVMPFLLQTTGNTFTDFQAPVGTTWHYTVRAEDSSSGGNGPAGGVEDANTHQVGHLSIDTQPPSFAGIDGAVSTCDAAGSINLSFPAATDTCTGVARFDVYRSTVPGALGALIGSSEGGGYQDVTGAPGTYYYTVRAVDGAGNSDANVAQLAAPAGEVAPSFDGVERVVATGCASNTLTWSPASTACGGREVHYNIYRSSDPAFTPGPDTLVTSCATAVPPTSSGGLAGEYFDDTGFAVKKASRVDATIDFDWGTGAPVPGIAPDTFAVRWTGELDVPSEGAYSLYLDANDGVRLEIDGYRVIDSWSNTTAERRGDITLGAGRHDIAIEYYDNTSSAKVRLLWQCPLCSPAIPKVVVPAARLYAPSRRWIDTAPIPGRPNYYIVRADDSPLAAGGDCAANEDTNLAREGVDVLAGIVGPGPSAAYTFNDGTANDVSGNLHQGTLYGPTFTADHGGALDFLGTELDHMEAAVVLPDSDHTVRFWFKTTGTPGMFEYMDGALGSATPGGGYDRTMYVTSASPAGRVCQRVSSDELICSATGGWNDGLWHEVAMVLERGVGQRMYIDGALVASGAKAVSAFNAGTRIWLGYSHDPSGTTSDYFTGQLDDLSLHDYVELQGASQCPAPPGVPDLALAEPCGTTPNRVALTWPAVPDATSYEVVRSTVSCASQASFAPIASGVTGTTYADTTVSGGDPAVAYFYKVRSYSSTTGMYSDFSSCQTCSPSGVCTRSPTFAGVGAAVSSHTTTCGNDVSWSPATSQCAVEGGNVTYSVYRSTSPSFVPSPFNRVASCVAGTSWHDGSTDLVSGFTYYYAVRAEDSTTAAKPYGAGGPCNNGNQDGNLVRSPVEVEGEFRVASFTDGAGDGSPPALALPPTNWSIAWFDQHTPGGTQAYYSSSQPGQCDALTTPVIDLRSAPEGETIPTVLSFWTSYRTSAGDGLVVEAAVGPAFDTWLPLAGDGVYTSTLGADNGCGLPAGTPVLGSTSAGAAWSGWLQRNFSLAGYQHQQVKLRFRLANGLHARADGGVLIDDLVVTNANVPIGCDGAAAPPACEGPPGFAGVSSVGAGAGPTSLAVAWGAATPTCAASTLRYNVYRATAAPFTPSAGNRIAACLDASTLADSGLVQNTVYSYIVRAEDVAHPGPGPCGGLEDTNLVTLSASPTASRTVATYDSFGGAALSSASWSWTPGWTQTGGAAYLPGAPDQCEVLTMNQWHTLAPGVNTYLSARLRYESEAYFDGGYFEITTDGSTWTRLHPEGGYPGNLVRSAISCTVPDASEQAGLSGSTAGAYRVLTFNLFAYSGSAVKVRLRWGSDATGVRPGSGVWLDELGFEQEACTPTGTDANCDRRDDDCDGNVDDGYQPVACGAGACTAFTACVDGVETSCAPGTPSASNDVTCNGVDEDCDGAVDEDCDACCCGPMSGGTCTTTASGCQWTAVDVFDSSCGDTVRQCWNYTPTTATSAAATSACAALTNAAGQVAALPSATALRSITTSSRFFDGASYSGQYLWTSSLQGANRIKQTITSTNSTCNGTSCTPGTCVQGAQATSSAAVAYGCLVAYPKYCGDTRCDAPENAASCAIDCAPTCGDHMCNGSETCGSCPADCGSTASPASCCGDGTCTRPQESHTSCPKDCP